MTIDFSKILVPFGVIMFAMGGLAAIPELEKLLPAKNRPMEKVIVLGTGIPMLLYILFTIIVVGITGTDTTPIATIGLAPYLGNSAFVLGGIVTVLAMSTSFLVLGLAVRQVYEWDLRLSKILAWTCAMIIPFTLYVVGVREFVRTIGIAGAVGAGLEGLLIIWAFFRARKMGDLEPKGVFVYHAKPITSVIVLLLLIGIASIFIS